MNLIALLIGLAVERLATQLFHWRRMRWLDRIIDIGFRQAERFPNCPPLVPIVALASVLVLPIFAVIFSLGDTLQGITYLILAVFVLFFSLGPTDIGEEIGEYCTALESGDESQAIATAKAIVEGDVPAQAIERVACVEAAVCVQANNRLFAVIFWFVVLGPLAAWAYRVTDLIRRRAVFNAARVEEDDPGATIIRGTAEMLHGWAAWVPARLTALGYVTAGHADEAIAALRAPTENRAASLSEHSDLLLARVGVAALALHKQDDESISERSIRGAKAAHRLVFRLLLVWTVIISAMTLYGLTR